MRRAIVPIFLLFFVLPAHSAVRTWDGGGPDTNWQTAANWAGDIAPATGDDLVFPASAAQFTANNNFFLFTGFNSITIEGSNYTIGGNPIRLANGLNVLSGTQTVNLAITLTGTQTFTAGQGSTTTLLLLSVGSFALTIDGAGSFGIGLLSGSGNLVKNGPGASLLAAASGYNGLITLNNGIFVVDAQVPNSFISITAPVGDPTMGLSGFGGTGSVGQVDVLSGAISAGTLASPTGILNINVGVRFEPTSLYVAKIAGTSPGAAGHDQLNVTGFVSIFDARLIPLLWGGFQPSIGDQFMVLKNDGSDAISGTFRGAPEGATFAGPLNTAFRITYQGGDGNDIVITRVVRSAFDYDGDGKSDVSVFRPSTGLWYLLRSTAGYTGMQWGEGTDKITPADYDGDGKTDVAVFRASNSTWYIFNSATQTFSTENWGQAGDLAVPADYDGDGKADVSVYRPSDANWYRKLSGGGFSFVNFGTAEDKPVPSDWDGDGRADIGVFRPSSGIWYFLRTTAGFTGIQWGVGADIQAPGDYDGDGKTDVAVFRPENGTWYLGMSTLGFASVAWGQSGDIPSAGDFDGDGKTDVAVFRPSNGHWYILNSTAGIADYHFGESGDQPTEGAYKY
jgi:hypothetical protein